MVIKEPSENIRKLKEYLNLSTDTVEISLEEQQSLEDVVLADDRERQKRNNAEALSMAIEKSSPLQKLTAFGINEIESEIKKLAELINAVSYTHLTLPTNREV